MKQWIRVVLCSAIILVIAGCRKPIPSENVKTYMASETTASEIPDIEQTETESSEQILSSTEGIDVDLTMLSSTMVYSEVYQMMLTPENYIGKTIKMDGLFSYLYDESTGKEYFSCIIQDATACCAQGIEFILAGDYSYPEDYPKEGEDVCVVGVFDTYTEGDSMYCTLRNAEYAN